MAPLCLVRKTDLENTDLENTDVILVYLCKPLTYTV